MRPQGQSSIRYYNDIIYIYIYVILFISADLFSDQGDTRKRRQVGKPNSKDQQGTKSKGNKGNLQGNSKSKKKQEEDLNNSNNKNQEEEHGGETRKNKSKSKR